MNLDNNIQCYNLGKYRSNIKKLYDGFLRDLGISTVYDPQKKLST